MATRSISWVTLICTILVFSVSLLRVANANGQTQTEEATAPNRTETLRLYNTSVADIMPMLGLFPKHAPDMSSTLTRVIGNIPSSPIPGIPSGIESVVPNLGDNSLRICGSEAAIQSLKTIIQGLDVAPQQVRLKVSLIAMHRKDAAELGIGSPLSGELGTVGWVRCERLSANTLRSIETLVKGSNVRTVASDMYTLLGDYPRIHLDRSASMDLLGAISKYSDRPQTDTLVLRVQPTTFNNNSIYFHISEPLIEHYNGPYVITSGETIGLWKIGKESGDYYLLLITPTIRPERKPPGSQLQTPGVSWASPQLKSGNTVNR